MKMNKSQRMWLLLISTLLAVACYLGLSQRLSGSGFPLDDAWIHQTYARNLVLTGGWSYSGGQASAGSTSPLWTGLLSAGYLLHISPIAWAVGLGILCLFVAAWVGDKIWMMRPGDGKYTRLPLFAILFVTEWHLVWAAVSGMETIFFILLIMCFAWLTLKSPQNWLMIGGVIGISAWVRPDGLTLFGPAFMLAWIFSVNSGDKMRNMGKVFAGAGLFIVPYLLFNFFIDGKIWPNTFFAKQAEYAILQSLPFIQRWAQLFFQLQIGVGVVLLPGVLKSCFVIIRKKDCWGISLFLWLLGYIAVYAYRLPVTYQHARYLMPVLPVYLFFGFWGFSLILAQMEKSKILTIIKKTWEISLIIVIVSFLWIGGRAYAEDVAIIETEMVASANWIAENTSQSSVIAAHDIGALGFFGQREIVDLAGLINPDVIPIIRDEVALLEYLSAKEIEYLMTFPGWYPRITSSAKTIFCTDGTVSIEAGGENMCVYQFERSEK